MHPKKQIEDARAQGVAIDPVCGMTVNPESAAGSFEHQGRTYYFCSKDCLQKFRDDPDALIKKTREPQTTSAQSVKIETHSTSAVGVYTCPMHPEVRQDKPGSCLKCGMALEPVAPQALMQKVEYTCPMHPEIVAV